MANFKDLTDRRFGKLSAVESHQKYGWHCRCDCGADVLAATKLLLRGSITSCGCRRKEFGKRTLIDMVGQKYGHVSVIGRGENDKRNHVLWLCKCDCGKEFLAEGYQLRIGKTTHCGCRRGEKHINCLSGFRSLFAQYRSRAKTCKLSFALDEASFLLLTSSDCYYCGTSPTRTRTSSQDHSPYTWNGIDRIDSACGYELWNCVPCCPECNVAKSDMSAMEFQSWLDRISNYHVSQFGQVDAIKEVMSQCA